MLDEAIPLLRYRLSHATAIRFAQPRRGGRGLTVVPVTAEDEEMAWSIFERYDDQVWSSTDCTSLAVMTRLGLDEAFAFGGDFEQYGLHPVLPRREPAAQASRWRRIPLLSQEQIAAVLGGVDSLGQEVESAADMIAMLERGLPWEAAERLKGALNLTDGELSRLLGVSDRTLRRLRQGDRRLEPRLSDRVYRLARIAAMTEDVLESRRGAAQWLRRPQVGLGNRVPLDMLGTEAGAREVEGLLGRIEHGVLS